MFCTGCGTKVSDGAVKCDNCGKAMHSISAPKPPSSGTPRQAPPGKVPSQGRPANPPANNAMDEFKRAAQFAPRPPGTKKAAAPPPVSEASEQPSAPVFSPIKQQSGLDFARAFSYFMKTTDWLKKYAILLLLSLVPILNFVTLGYYVQLINNASQGMDSELPEIDVKNQFISGALFVLALFLFMIPASIIFVTLFFFAKIPVVNVFAFIFIILYWLILATYLTGAFVLAAMEGNPWVIFRFQQCTMAIQNCLFEVILVGIILTALGTLSNFIITIPLFYLCGGHLAGQLGRILRTHTRL